jgi:acyl carrier protein
MSDNNLNTFVSLIRNQFSEKAAAVIDEHTDLKTLKEWSSLQTMIVVNEIDKTYNVVLSSDDFNAAENIYQLFKIVQTKLS